MLSNLFNWICRNGMIVPYLYQLLFTSAFLCTPVENSRGIEALADRVLTPVHYLFAARVARTQVDTEDLYYRFEQKFNYNEPLFWVKTTASIISLPITFPAGLFLKTFSYISPEARAHYRMIVASDASRHIDSNLNYYQSVGINLGNYRQAEFITPLGLDRKPGDELTMESAKLALKEIFQVLQDYQIPAWIDCGTCLGAYRYGGVIPWDLDVDIAILEKDHDNVQRVLQALDPDKYLVVDLSPRSSPKSLFNVQVIATGDRIDIYHYRLDPEKKELFSLVAFEHNSFIPEHVKFGDRMCSTRVAFDIVFPLKKVNFDGVIVPVPNQIVAFNQSKYGEDLSPVKVYDEEIGEWKMDLAHPYWLLQGSH
jgi:hypothetical protein